MAGVQIIQGSDTSNDQETVMANSAFIDFQDPVTITAGYLARSAAGQPIEGFFEEARKAVAADNQTVALTTGQWDGNLYDVVVQMNTLEDDAIVQANVGLYFNIAVDIDGNITCDTATLSGATGQFQLIDFDPNRDGSTNVVRAKVAYPEQLAFLPIVP